ncbi:hypothetical protein GCM10023175_61340 [Pseudonocardia xishanensis]|uniref:Uncharacterized protein n=1 Tax=Pseudonocardia xishanensis TaxID=630995 RepID=A0ABP8S2J8_9PSEU
MWPREAETVGPGWAGVGEPGGGAVGSSAPPAPDRCPSWPRPCRGRSDHAETPSPGGHAEPNRSAGSSLSGRIEWVMKPGAPGSDEQDQGDTG